MTNGEKLKDWRLQKGWSMDAVAAWLGDVTNKPTSRHSIDRWEKNKRIPYRLYAEAIYKITEGLVDFSKEQRPRFLEVKPERVRKPTRTLKCRQSLKIWSS
jgi:transcriptional regulator with XRE-family HTH domain